MRQFLSDRYQIAVINSLVRTYDREHGLITIKEKNGEK
jgi:hypothetical protein